MQHSKGLSIGSPFVLLKKSKSGVSWFQKIMVLSTRLALQNKKQIISKFCAFSLPNFAAFRYQTLWHSTSKLCGIIRSFGAILITELAYF